MNLKKKLKTKLSLFFFAFFIRSMKKSILQVLFQEIADIFGFDPSFIQY